MANELKAIYPSDKSLQVVVRKITDDDVWYPTIQDFEVWGVAGRSWSNYDITGGSYMTDKGGNRYSYTMDANNDSNFQLYYDVRDVATEEIIWTDKINWSGTEEKFPNDHITGGLTLAMGTSVLAHVDGLGGAAMRGNDNANTVVPDNTSIAAILIDTETTLNDMLEALVGYTDTEIAAILKLLRADKVIDTSASPWVVDYFEEGTVINPIMSKTLKDTAGNNVTSKNNVLGRLQQE